MLILPAKVIFVWNLQLEKYLRGAVARTYWTNSHQVGREEELRPGEGSSDPKLFLSKIILCYWLFLFVYFSEKKSLPNFASALLRNRVTIFLP